MGFWKKENKENGKLGKGKLRTIKGNRKNNRE